MVITVSPDATLIMNEMLNNIQIKIHAINVDEYLSASWHMKYFKFHSFCCFYFRCNKKKFILGSTVDPGD
jgi:hypothetical protein